MYANVSPAESALRIGAAMLGGSSLGDAFNRAKLDLLQAINRFTARFKRLPELEAQVKAIGVYALKAPPQSAAKKRLVAEYASGIAQVEQLKARADFVREKSAEAMAELRRIAGALGLGSGPGLGVLQGWAIPAVVIAASAAAIAWALAFDRQARNNAKVLEWAQRQGWSVKQTREVLDAMNQAGAIPDPRRLGEFLGEVSSAVVFGILAVLFGPRLYRALKRRRA